MKIRRLKPDDEPEIARLIAAAHELAAASPIVPIGPRWSASQIAQECAAEGYVVEGGEGRISAFILFHDLIDAWEITFLATDIGTLRKGVMASLFGYLTSQLPPEKQVWLEVHEANSPARRFYEKMRMKEVGRRAKYYADGGAAILYTYR